MDKLKLHASVRIRITNLFHFAVFLAAVTKVPDNPLYCTLFNEDALIVAQQTKVPFSRTKTSN